VKKGDWISDMVGDSPQIGRVRDVYGNGALVDVVLYDRKGERVGRRSPAMGGPTTFEPACPSRLWVVVEPPAFPLPRTMFTSDTGSLGWGYRPALKVRA
jgi:hypothetical protein